MKNRSVGLVVMCLVAFGVQLSAHQDAVQTLDVAFEQPSFRPVKPLLDASPAVVGQEKLQALANSFGQVADKQQGLVLSSILNDGLTANRYEGFLGDVDSALESLDYVTSKSVRIQIPKTSYSVVIDWGFGGSGELDLELMMPLPTVMVRLERDENVHTFFPGRDEALYSLGRVIIENELQKFAQKSDGELEVLKHIGISPILKPRMVFLWKFALLVHHTMKNQNVSFFYEELARLVFRLVLSGDISLHGEEDAPLSSLLPASFVTRINSMVPLLLPIADQLFISTKNLFTSNSSDAVAGNKTFTYVFLDEVKAQQFAAFAQTVVDKSDCMQSMDKFLTEHAQLQVIDYEELHKLLDGDAATVTGSMRFLVGKVVSYGNDVDDLVDYSLLTVDEIAKLPAAGCVQTFGKKSVTVVSCCSDKSFFDESETFSAMAKVVASAWTAYVDTIRNEVAQKHDVGATEVLLEDARERKELKEFFASEDGQKLQEKLEYALEAARNPFERSKMKLAAIVSQLEAKELELLKANEKLVEKDKVLTKLAQRRVKGAAAKSASKMIDDISIEMAALKGDIAELEAAVATLREQEAALESEKDSKHIEIEQILQALVAQRQSGRALDVDMRRRLETLQQELAMKDEKKAQDALSPQDKLDLRDAVLRVYEEELDEVSNELVQIEQENLSSDSLARESRLTVYKKFLQKRISRMTEQQENLRTLIMYRESLKQIGSLAPDRMTKLYEFERDLGFILESNDVLEICRVTKPKLSLAQRFIQEVTQPMPGSVFEPMHKAFVDNIATVITRSGFLRENNIMVKYLLGQFFPAVQQEILVKVAAAVGAR